MLGRPLVFALDAAVTRNHAAEFRRVFFSDLLSLRLVLLARVEDIFLSSRDRGVAGL